MKNTSPNGFQFNNPHGIENFSTVPNTINKMFYMGRQGVVRVFPVWPKDKDASFSTLRVHRAFLISSELKDGPVQFLEITSEKGRDCTIVNPWKPNSILAKKQSGTVEMFVDKRYVLKTVAGKKIQIVPIYKVTDKNV